MKRIIKRNEAVLRLYFGMGVLFSIAFLISLFKKGAEGFCIFLIVFFVIMLWMAFTGPDDDCPSVDAF